MNRLSLSGVEVCFTIVRAFRRSLNRVRDQEGQQSRTIVTKHRARVQGCAVSKSGYAETCAGTFVGKNDLCERAFRLAVDTGDPLVPKVNENKAVALAPAKCGAVALRRPHQAGTGPADSTQSSPNEISCPPMHTCHAPFPAPTYRNSSGVSSHNYYKHNWPLRQIALNARLDARPEVMAVGVEDISIEEGTLDSSVGKNDDILPSRVFPRLVVVGGGAAGIFGALRAKEVCPQLHVTVLERAEPLRKVRISGGGRCNVTTGLDLQPLLLAKQYPRGHKELRGGFFRTHGPTDTAKWFQQRGVQLKTEADGRMFPQSDSSATIIDCLLEDASRLGVDIVPATPVATICRTTAANFSIRPRTKPDCDLAADFVLLATGSDPQGYRLAASLAHTLLPPRPSLFTLKIPDPALTALAGISFPHVRASLALSTAPQRDPTLCQSGPLLITHWGLSGPLILRLSAWAALHLYAADYKGVLFVDFLPDTGAEELLGLLVRHREASLKRKVGGGGPVELQLPRRFWQLLLEKEGEFKDEFVTAGGVPLAEIHLSRMESKVCPGLFLAGEVVDVDGVTGGYNFQNAWTGGFIAGSAIAQQAQALLHHQN